MGNGEVKRGQDFDRERGLVFPYTEQIENLTQGGTSVDFGADNTEIVVVDANSVKKRKWTQADIEASIVDEYKGFASSVSFELPPTLVSLTTSYNENKGNGAASFGVGAKGGFAAVGASVGATQSPRASAQASAATIADVFSVIRENLARDVPCQTYIFYMTGVPTLDKVRAKLTRLTVTGQSFTVTLASPGVFTASLHGFSVGDEVFLTTTGALYTGLAQETPYFIKTVPTTSTFTVSLTSGGTAVNTSGSQSGTHKVYRAIKAWPHFKPEQIEILCRSQEVTLQQNAETQATVNANNTSAAYVFAYGDGYSQSRGATSKLITYPPTLHGAIAVAGSLTKTSTVTVDVDADSKAMIVSGVTVVAAIANDPAQLSDTIVTSVTPTSFSATSPADVPVTGLYMRPPKPSVDIFGLILYTVDVIDMTYFA